MELSTWKELGIGAFKEGSVDEVAFTARLERAKELQRVLNTPQPIENKIVFVVGNCQQTLMSIDAEGASTYVAGDSRVPEASAFPVERSQMSQETFYSCATHDKQLADKDVLKKVFQFLQ